MTNTAQFTKAFQDAFAAMPFQSTALQDAFKSQAAMGEKLSQVALEAAEKSTELTAKWTGEMLGKFAEVTKVKADPAEYSKAATDFATAAADLASENLASFAEIAKKVQMETVELMLAAGKDMSSDAAKVMQKATTDAARATKASSK